LQLERDELKRFLVKTTFTIKSNSNSLWVAVNEKKKHHTTTSNNKINNISDCDV
jgi:hypothetical protein